MIFMLYKSVYVVLCYQSRRKGPMSDEGVLHACLFAHRIRSVKWTYRSFGTEASSWSPEDCSFGPTSWKPSRPSGFQFEASRLKGWKGNMAWDLGPMTIGQ